MRTKIWTITLSLTSVIPALAWTAGFDFDRGSGLFLLSLLTVIVFFIVLSCCLEAAEKEIEEKKRVERMRERHSEIADSDSIEKKGFVDNVVVSSGYPGFHVD